MDGRATFTTVWSRMIISIPAQSTTRAHCRERADGAAGGSVASGGRGASAAGWGADGVGRASAITVSPPGLVEPEGTVTDRLLIDNPLRNDMGGSGDAPAHRPLAGHGRAQAPVHQPVQGADERAALALRQRGQDVAVD